METSAALKWKLPPAAAAPAEKPAIYARGFEQFWNLQLEGADALGDVRGVVVHRRSLQVGRRLSDDPEHFRQRSLALQRLGERLHRPLHVRLEHEPQLLHLARLDLLEQVLSLIDEDRRDNPGIRSVIVLLGDYIDRGPDSMGVIECLVNRSERDNLVCLKGNHEDWLLQFLANPDVLQEWGGAGFFGVGVYVRRFLDILGMLFLAKFTLKPLRFFGTLGGVFFLIGGLLLGWIVFRWVVYGDGVYQRPLFLIGLLITLLGVQIIGFGLVGEIIIYTQARNLREYRIERIHE